MIFRFGLQFLITTTLLLLIAPLGNADSHCDFAEETVLIGGVVPLSAPGSVAGGIGMKWGFEQACSRYQRRLRYRNSWRESSR